MAARTLTWCNYFPVKKKKRTISSEKLRKEIDGLPHQRKPAKKKKTREKKWKKKPTSKRKSGHEGGGGGGEGERMTRKEEATPKTGKIFT